MWDHITTVLFKAVVRLAIISAAPIAIIGLGRWWTWNGVGIITIITLLLLIFSNLADQFEHDNERNKEILRLLRELAGKKAP